VVQQVLADAGEIVDHVDAEVAKRVRGADARE